MGTERSCQAIYARLFQKLNQLIPDLLIIEARGISKVANGTLLYLDVQSKWRTRIVVILAQYYQSTSGDWIPAPEMEIAVYPLQQTAEVLACHEPCDSCQVYRENGAVEAIQIKVKLNGYLDMWLSRLIEQGHVIKADEVVGE